MIDPFLFTLANIPVCGFIGYVIYGSGSEFVSQLRAWLGRVVSIEFFDGAIFPPLRLQLWLYASAALLCGEYLMLRG